VLETARWRYDIPHWRWRQYGCGGEAGGVHHGDFDDSAWDVTPHLHRSSTPTTTAAAGLGTTSSCRSSSAGQVINVVLGGMDDEDWNAYCVFLNGEQIAAWRGHDRLREPGTVELRPGDERYALLSFAAQNVPAVEVQGHERRFAPRAAESSSHPGELLGAHVRSSR
jgi:hypothetical protein